MIGLAVLLCVALVAFWGLVRRRRAAILAGRDSERPVYSVAPPARRLGDRRRELL